MYVAEAQLTPKVSPKQTFCFMRDPGRKMPRTRKNKSQPSTLTETEIRIFRLDWIRQKLCFRKRDMTMENMLLIIRNLEKEKRFSVFENELYILLSG